MRGGGFRGQEMPRGRDQIGRSRTGQGRTGRGQAMPGREAQMSDLICKLKSKVFERKLERRFGEAEACVALAEVALFVHCAEYGNDFIAGGIVVVATRALSLLRSVMLAMDPDLHDEDLPDLYDEDLHNNVLSNFQFSLALRVMWLVYHEICNADNASSYEEAGHNAGEVVPNADEYNVDDMQGRSESPDHVELVVRRWGGSTHLTVEEVKKKIADLLGEYVESGDTSEACRCIRQLGVAFFHHEVVKRALVLAMEILSTETIMKLLKEAADEGLISSSQMLKGFMRLAESLDDLALDITSAKTDFHSLVLVAISEGWLDEAFLKSSGKDGEVDDKDKEKLRRYKAEVVTIIHEYFLSGDIPELIRSLEDLAAPKYNPVFLKKLITLAMDRENREKEMASILLSALRIVNFSTDDLVNGFVMLLESAEDTALDALDASNELALFLARAVIDNVLAPLNLEKIASRLAPNCSGSETVHVAQSLIGARHAGERILRCWSGGTGWAVDDTKDEIVKLLEEYESGGVTDKACQCVRDVGMLFLHHEVVKKALFMAMEKKNDRMLDLLQVCFNEGLITINQMTKGFGRIKDGLDDLALDIPNAKEKFSFYMELAKGRGWLLPSFDVSV